MASSTLPCVTNVHASSRSRSTSASLNPPLRTSFASQLTQASRSRSLPDAYGSALGPQTDRCLRDPEFVEPSSDVYAAHSPIVLFQLLQFAKAKALVDSGTLGHPGVIRTVRGGSPPDPDRRVWFTDFEQSGGVIMDVSIHDLDIARWCFGDVERIFARGLTYAGVEPYDHALITLRFKNGAIGHVEGSWADPPGRFRTRFEMAGDRGLVEWDSTDSAPLTVTLKSDELPQAPGIPRPYQPLAPHDDPYFAELEHCLQCLESGDEFLVSPQDGLEAVRLSLAAIESIRTGRSIYLDEFEV